MANERDASSREGRLAESSLPELLARAYRVSFSGSLVLEPADSTPSSLRFVGGSVVEVTGPWKEPAIEWEAIGKLLPPDSVEFAMQHAEQYGVEPFDAVSRLVLLPPESIVSARQALVVRGVEELCSLSGDVRYSFVGPGEADSKVAPTPAVEPLGLLAACFLVESQRERAARSVVAYEYATLSVDAERARHLLPTLNGPTRAVLDSLLRAPAGIQALRERNLVPNPELIAAVCALWITREVTVRVSEPPAAGPVRARSSATPPAGFLRPSALPPIAARPSVAPPTHSVPPFVQAASNMPPPRKNSGFIRAERGDAERVAKEQAMVQKVEEAWMRAEADPSRAHEITGIVTKAIAVFPKNPRLHYYLARLHIQANRVEEAVNELERVLELDPRDAQAEAELTKLRARFGGALGNR